MTYTRTRLAAAAVAISLVHSSLATGAIITGFTRTGSTNTPGPAPGNPLGLQEEVLAFSDRTHQYNGSTAPLSIAAIGMAGAEYIMPDNDDRNVAAYQLAVTLGETADLFVLIDDRVGDGNNANPPTLTTLMPWVASMGFVNTGVRLGVDENGDGVGPGASIQNFATIYKRANSAAGTYNLGAQNDGTGRNMYGVAALPPGPGPVLPPADPPVPYDPPNYALIDLGATGGRPEPDGNEDIGGVQQIGAAANGVNATNMPLRTMISSTGDYFHITVDNIDQTGTPIGPNGLDWRDRGDAYSADPPHNQPLVKLAEDFVKNNAGVIHVTLQSLPFGTFEVTSFHADADNSQSEAIQILVDSELGLGYQPVGVASALWPGAPPTASGLSTFKALSRSSTFIFYHDHAGPVHILFDGRAALDFEVPLNGLALSFEPVPEPTSFGLVGFGLAGLALSAWRRRRAR